MADAAVEKRIRLGHALLKVFFPVRRQRRRRTQLEPFDHPVVLGDEHQIEATHRHVRKAEARALRLQRRQIHAGAVALDGQRMGQHRTGDLAGDHAGIGA